ncbi:MAG: agmatinase [Chloroflexi bacterium]|nr:agmatinase [Chloroflexota bacterium]
MDLVGNRNAAGGQSLLRQGWPTFFGAPACSDMSKLKADIAFLGVPLDSTTNDRPGSRFGPLGIRDVSMRYQRHEWDGWFDQESGGNILRGVTMADCGDVDIRVVDLAVNFDKITRATEMVLDRRAFPALVGGDHAITFPSVRAHGRPVHIVYFDAHVDFTDEWQGVKFSHDNPLRRVSELPFVTGITLVGIRGVLSRANPYWEAREKGATMISSQELRERGVSATLSRLPSLGDTYVSVDIDVLDPAVAPGTGYPEPGGLTYYELKQALLEVAQRGRVVGFDLVEVAPWFDPTQRTTRTAARLILDFMGAVFAARSSRAGGGEEAKAISTKGGMQ